MNRGDTKALRETAELKIENAALRQQTRELQTALEAANKKASNDESTRRYLNDRVSTLDVQVKLLQDMLDRVLPPRTPRAPEA